MKRRLPTVILTIILVATWAGTAGAGQALPYNLDKAERGFYEPPSGPPGPAAVAADAAIGRPLGLAMTIAGTGLFVLTLPFTAPSGNVREAAWGLIGQQGGWTFCRPLGRSDPRYERMGVFK
jgi:hypothetical protein